MAKIIEKTMISYSPSFEDVMLQRALQGVEYGCYVDVGASRPLHDSNTAAFYQKGWRGICVEPLTYLNSFWEKFRPEDILVNGVVGATTGETTFYYYSESTQVSTCSAEVMEHWKQNGLPPDQEITVPMVTLNQLMEQFLGGRTIHLLSIDAEGCEKQVLQGFDLEKYHPWVMVIEATIPGTHEPSYAAWESEVLGAGYTMVYEEGVNRFYLSNTKPELKKYFRWPPTVWDGFISFKQDLAEKRLEEMKLVNEELMTEIETLKKILEDSKTLSVNFWDYIPHPDDLARQRALTQLEEENKALKDQLRGLYQTLSLKNFLNEP